METDYKTTLKQQPVSNLAIKGREKRSWFSGLKKNNTHTNSQKHQLRIPIFGLPYVISS